jgi:short subunit dehydrogenase-like uncharacterized protein
MRERTWMLYGANGYTGRLLAEHAASMGMRPTLAGRNGDAVRALAARLGLESSVFGLDDPREVSRRLEGFTAVLHAAGPFSATSRPMLEACLERRAHYLDITGEVAVFESCRAQHERAVERGIVILPGVGFDVVPSDCLAASIARALPDASRLQLAFAGGGSSSAGTTKTAFEALATGVAVRRNGRLDYVPFDGTTIEVPFRDKPRRAMRVPWGDVSTAYVSTDIPNIEVYMAVDSRVPKIAALVGRFGSLVGRPSVQRAVKTFIDARVRGPSAEVRESGRSQLWGRARNAEGQTAEGTLVTPEGYRLTTMTAIDVMRRVLEGQVASGYQTPSKAFGADYITTFDGCDLRVG